MHPRRGEYTRSGPAPHRPLVGLAASLVAALLGPGCGSSAGQPPRPPTSLVDPRLAPLRVASASWAAARPRPRRVVDVACLVSDASEFAAALRGWDGDHWFPIVFDDDEFSLKFLRAFRPARVIRPPTPASAIPPGRLWDAIGEAVAAARGGGDPDRLGRSPGVVLSEPSSPSLPAAAALAAGRGQALLRWEPGRRFGETLTAAEADALAIDVEARVDRRLGRPIGLGDASDFLTLAGDYPYAYEVAGGPSPGRSSLDDRLGIDVGSGVRWAYVGRITGDQASSTYRAMASMFLRVESAVLFNGYETSAPPWSHYAMDAAAARLGAVGPVTVRSGPTSASPEGWRRLFGGGNRAGLALINSSGAPDLFHLRGGDAGLADVPESAPCVVHNIHSFSAVDPRDPATLAARWLDGGAFVYFGAMNEPYLTSFRNPTLIADLIAEGLPLAAAFRQGQGGEDFPAPWRVVYLGDPLFSIDLGPTPPRVAAAPRVSTWPDEAGRALPAGDDPEAVLARIRSSTILGAARGDRPSPTIADLARLRSIPRSRLSPSSRLRLDALLVEAADGAGPAISADLASSIAAIPRSERTRRADRILARSARLGRTDDRR